MSPVLYQVNGSQGNSSAQLSNCDPRGQQSLEKDGLSQSPENYNLGLKEVRDIPSVKT